ncbi:soluble P-type ATPase [Sporomusaceae bacterium BoRhaA]|uniref:HAD family hydrolase n=1 Tax=Pelorhabdus rhamnosifermentans TaxID=2772457 RepID=UPI001C05F62A|nr:hypothetical protein [Pelorhabdus rhamnosifermentans]MBU2701263.1 soluble P-type ATPase [Pelorhabdus rhamnosifermentans]
MISIQLPNGRQYEFRHVVFDYNGVLAENGRVSEEVRRLLAELASKVFVVVITADTFGTAQEELKNVPDVELIVLPEDKDGKEKARYVQKWGADTTAVVGNGVNDQPMFFIAGLKICVLGAEGVSGGIMAAANIVVPSPEDAIKLFLNPMRLSATLRS